MDMEDGYYIGEFPQLVSGSEVEYYLEATNTLGTKSFHPNAGWHLFTTSESIAGDINGDGSVNIQDVILVINMVLGQSAQDSGDVNGDGLIDILDIVLLVNIILDRS